MEPKFVGRKNKDGACEIVRSTDQGEEVLDPRLDLWNHSPSGCNFGYGGSGAAQTALSILCAATGKDRLSVSLHQRFKWAFIAKAKGDRFELSEEEVLRWVEEKAKELDPYDLEEEAEEVEEEESMAAAAVPPARAERTREISLGVTGDRAFVRKLLAVGGEFDLSKGGHYDARSGVINLWCSPEDKPAGWDRPITKGALPYPRELVGSLTWNWTGDDEVALAIDLSPYALLPDRDRYQWEKLPEALWDSCREWVKTKALELVRFARMPGVG